MSIQKKIILTGATGLVGSRFIDLFKNSFQIITIGRENTDITINLMSPTEVTKTIEESDADIVVNFAAYTNVDGAEKEKGEKSGEVYTLNTLVPLWLTKACKATDKKLFHISTDYVFDGDQDDRSYTEDDQPKPVDSWYAQTKYFGEQSILESSYNKTAIIRIAYPYSGVYSRKLDIARVVVEKISKGEEYFGITDQKIKPTSVDDISKALSFLIEKDVLGIYHVAGNYSPNEYITPYQFAQNIAKSLDLNTTLIKPISFLELSRKRVAPRPQNTWLNTKKIEDMGFSITNINEALNRFKEQLMKK